MEHIRYIWLSERQEHDTDKEGNPIKHPYLNLGEVSEFSTARMIVGAIRTIALSTGHPDLVEYALELTRCLIEWDKKLPQKVVVEGAAPTPDWPSGAHR